MRIKRGAGLTMVEVLIVALIISLIAALLVPIFARSRAAAHRATCVSNLRQIGAALTMYDDASGDYPQDASLLAVEGPLPRSLLLCAADPFGGFGATIGKCHGKTSFAPISYESMLDWLPHIKAELLAADPNHGILACRLHGEKDARPVRNLCYEEGMLFNGAMLRLRRDSSVETSRYEIHAVEWPPGSGTRFRGASKWDLFTDEQPPKRFPF